ncbi:MAG: HAMP domain-containing protein [Bryobacterales bacterium]|nr:HAMP domain-containing protein [Bryobacterales bacterium]
MRSIFAKIVLWFGAMLLFSFGAFLATTMVLSRRNTPVDHFLKRIHAMQLDDARAAYETGGKQALSRELARMDRYILGAHYLLDNSGVDLVTGENRQAMLQASRAPGPRRPFRPRGPILIRQTSPDGRYNLIVRVPEAAFGPPNNAYYYYGAILLIVIVLCYALALTLVKPLRRLRETVLRFGSGDLGARARLNRRDEFGDLARAFDEMADRIETLLTTERRLFQDVSHELRSPLARLQFAVELARTSGDRQAAIDRIKRETEILSTLVNELIRMNQAEGDPAERKVEPVELKQLLSRVLDECRLEAEAKHCDIKEEIATPCTVMADEKLLSRAFENVLRNAIRYSPERETIEVGVQRKDRSALVTIQDRGPGVPESMLKDIFRPFFRVQSDRGRGTGGSGLGLAIAERAIRLHHGAIHAANAQPGLRVEIRVPTSDAYRAHDLS